MLILRKKESHDHLRAVISTQNELQPIIEQVAQEKTVLLINL